VLSTIHEFDREAYVALLEGQSGRGAVGRDRTLPAELRLCLGTFGRGWTNDFTFTPTLTNKPYGADSLSDTGRINELFLFYRKSTSPKQM
jgi:hypothetical protein